MHSRYRGTNLLTQGRIQEEASATGSPVKHAEQIQGDAHSFMKVLEGDWDYFYPTVGPHLYSLQPDVTAKMRTTLVDWLVEVSEEFRLVPETLFLSVSYVDRYLRSEKVPRKSLQLLGVACIFLAAKFEEIYSPQICDLCDITDNTYVHDQVVGMERKVLQALNFRLCQPTVNFFLTHYVAENGLDEDAVFVSRYLCELTLLHHSFHKFRASQIAASAVVISRAMLTHGVWTAELQRMTGYDLSCLTECINTFKEVVASLDVSASAVTEKYSQGRFNEVAKKLHNSRWNWPALNALD